MPTAFSRLFETKFMFGSKSLRGLESLLADTAPIPPMSTDSGLWAY